MKKSMKTYTKTVTIKAKLFQRGDQDGFITRYTDGVPGPDGKISTWGIGHDGMKKVKVPYINGSGGYQRKSIGFGREYICKDENGTFFIEKSEFEKTYQPKKK